MRARGDVTERAGLGAVDRAHERDIREVRPAPERIVYTYHVARVQASELLEGRLHAHRHRTEVHRHVVAHRDRAPRRIEERARVILALFDVRRKRGAFQGGAHFFSQGSEEMAEDFECDRVGCRGYGHV